MTWNLDINNPGLWPLSEVVITHPLPNSTWLQSTLLIEVNFWFPKTRPIVTTINVTSNCLSIFSLSMRNNIVDTKGNNTNKNNKQIVCFLLSKLSHYPDLGVSAIATVTCVGGETLRVVSEDRQRPQRPGAWSRRSMSGRGRTLCANTGTRSLERFRTD